MKNNGIYNNKITSSSNIFNLLPRELMYTVLEKLNYSSILNFRQTCKENKNEVDYYPAQCFYFAVGDTLPLYEYKYLIHPYSCKIPKKVTDQEVLGSLPKKNMKLFSNLEDALDYKYLICSREYVVNLDVFLPIESVAIFLVKIKNGMLKRPKMMRLEESWKNMAPIPDGPWAGDYKIKYLECMETPRSNLENVYFSQLDGKRDCQFFHKNIMFFKRQFPEKFYQIWQNAMQSGKSDLFKMSLQAINELFKTYSFSFYSKFTRHNKKEVDTILNSINLNPTHTKDEVIKLYHLLNTLKEEAKSEKKNVMGHYYLMLDFVTTNLEQILDIAKLDNINKYFSP